MVTNRTKIEAVLRYIVNARILRKEERYRIMAVQMGDLRGLLGIRIGRVPNTLIRERASCVE